MSGLEGFNASSSAVHGGLDSAASQLSQSPVFTKGLCLLSLDGGGVRGLSTLIILRYLMAKVNSELPPEHHKKPYEIFDMIGGTSTGGLIAIMLGRLKMDVQECIDVYNSMFEEIFGSPVHKFKVTVAFQIQSQFDSEILRRCILRIVAKSQNLADVDKKAIATAMSLPGSQKAKDALIRSAAAKVLLDDGEARGCRTFVCATAYETQNTVHFRDYPRADLGVPNKVTIVDAACATSAATSYFDAVVINGRTYRDGAFGANNPVNEVWHEAREVWVKDEYDDEVQLDKILKCFISIGTGVPKTEGMKESVKGFVDTLKNMVTQTKRSADDFMKSHRNLTKIDGRQRYFRFNVDQGLQEVGLEEYKKTPLVEAATEGYMESPDRENLVALCANNLKLKTSFAGSVFCLEIKVYCEAVETQRLNAQKNISSLQKNAQADGSAPEQLDLQGLSRWLDANEDHLTTHIRIRNRRIHAESGQWIFENPSFQGWCRQPGLKLWMHGKVGSGKTVLCSSIIESLQSQQGEGATQTAPVLYYYFDFNKSEHQNLESVIISMVYQLCISQRRIPKQIQALYSKYRKQTPERPIVPIPPRDDLLHLFLDICHSLSTQCFLLLDAMDEIPHGEQRDDILYLLHELTNPGVSKVSLLVTSQPEPDFSNTFRWDLGWTNLGMSSSRVDADIGLFVRHAVSTASKFSGLSGDDRKKIEDYLTKEANSVFQWVALMLQMLQIPRVLRSREIEEILHSLPKDLKSTYDRLLQRVDESDAPEVAVALKWLSLAQRLLFIEEVIEASILNSERNIVLNTERRLTAQQILSCLTGLVTLEPPLVSSDLYQAETHVLALAHSSVRKYLISKDSGVTSSNCFLFDEGLAHEFIAKCCVEYISHCYASSWRTKLYPLARYSTRYWISHAQHNPRLLSYLKAKLENQLASLLYPEAGKAPKLLEGSWEGSDTGFANSTGEVNHRLLEDDPPVDIIGTTQDIYMPLRYDKREFRVLLLLPSESSSSPLECRLQVVSMDEAPYYQALSYSWDPNMDPQWIYVDGTRISVNLNLACAMLQIRSESRAPRVLWIDALCINLIDTSERNLQVSLIPLIFKNAVKTIVWLGYETSTSYLAMGYLSSFEDLPRQTESVSNRLLSMSIETWTALQELLALPWFRKVWIIQEAVLARDIEVMCGSSCVPWSVFARIEEAYSSHGHDIHQYTFKLLATQTNSTALPSLSEFSRLILCNPHLTAIQAIRRRYHSDLGFSFREVMLLTQAHECANLRDKMIAVMRIMHEPPPISLDGDIYTIAIEELCCRLAVSLIRSSDDLDILSYPAYLRDRPEKLPSWVPDFTKPLSRSLDQGDVALPFKPRCRRLYSAGTLIKPAPSFTETSQFPALNLSAIHVDTVRMTGQPRTPAAWRTYMDLTEVQNRYGSISMNEVFCRTFLADQKFISIDEEPRRLGASWLEWREPEQILSGWDDVFPTYLNTRTFFVSRDGYVGLCPEIAKEGDHIVIFLGSRLPSIIRPTGNDFLLIGEAYVHGIMDGELLATKKLRRWLGLPQGLSKKIIQITLI